MKSLWRVLVLASSLSPAWAAEEGFVSMFNGRDLSGWTNINCAPETWTVKDGNIHCTGRPVGALRTLRQYENFIIEAEWRHLSSGGNSGMFMWGTAISAPGVPFLRGIEVQVLDHGYAEQWEKENGKKSDWFTTHGDVFPIHGATMKPHGPHRGDRSFPTEERSKRSPEWNHYRVVASNGVLRLSVNGKEVSGGSECNYRKGYLALESEGAPVEFRNIRIKELPSGNPDPKMVAPLDPGWVPLYNGLDLRGWRKADLMKDRWRANDWQLSLKAATDDVRHALWTEGTFGDVEFTLDVKPGKEAKGADAPSVLLDGRGGQMTELKLTELATGKWSRVRIRTSGGQLTLWVNDKEIETGGTISAEGFTFGLKDTGVAVEFGNLHVRKL